MAGRAHDRSAGDMAAAAPQRERAPSITAAPASLHAVLQLQRTAGNAATVRALQRSPATAAPAAETAETIIERFDHWYGLDHGGLGPALLAMLPERAALVVQVFDKVSSSNRDDVAEALADSATDDQLRAIAKDPAGRDALRRVVRELLAGWSTDNENRQMRRIMAIVSEQAPLVDRPGSQGKTIEIEVVTFDKGGAAMDFMGQKVAPVVWKGMFWRSDDRRNQFGEGARGHTAILVGGLAYSYEGTGWRVGQNAQEYMKDATAHRDASSQVLLLPIDDARKIQAHLNAVANQGVYLLGGEICSDATGTALEKALGTLSKDANPQRLRNQLETSGRVSSHRFYKAGGDGLPVEQ